MPVHCTTEFKSKEDLGAILVAEALVAHVLAQNAAIRDEAAVCNAHVVVNLEDLLVGTQKLILCSVQGNQNNMCVALQQASDILAEPFNIDEWKGFQKCVN